MRGISGRGAPRETARPGGPVLWALAAAVVTALVVFDTVTLLSPRTEPSELWDTWVYGFVMTGAAAVALVRAVTVRAERALWATLGVAIALYAGGDWLYTLWIQDLEPEPYPSIGDLWWIAFYVVVALAVVGLVRAELPSVPASVWLDGLVAGLGAATLASALSFDTIARAGSGGSALETAVNLAYPLADLTLLGITAAAMAVQRWRIGARWALLGTGLLAFSGGDTAYVFASATGGYTAGGLIDLSWPTGAVLMALAALTPPPRRLSPRREGTAVVVIPVALAALALAVLVAQRPLGVTGLSLVLAGLTVLAALIRIALTVREVSTLAATRVQASTDELTGLANRRLFFEVLQRATARRSARVAVVMVDLDRFKDVNDSLGHDVGDELLRAVARRLQASLGEGALVARLGGDEFAIVLEAGAGAPTAVERMRAALREVCEPVAVGAVTLRPSASAGVALSSGRTGDVDALLRSADSALYRAKLARGSVALATADDEIGRHGEERRVAELRAGFDDGALVVRVQPQVDLGTGAVTRVEATPRFAHHRDGLLGTDELVARAVQAGLVPALTAHVVDEALAARALWQAQGWDVGVSVKLSAADLMDEGLADGLVRAMERHATPAGRLELQVDERSVQRDLDHAARVLTGLRRTGASIALDGFDVERSSLGPLNLLPLETVRLVTPSAGDSVRAIRSRETARSVVGVARSLGLRVVAVGVDDLATERYLREIGCHALQGLVRAAAMTVQDLTAWRDATYGVADRSTETTRCAETRETAPDATSTTTTEPASIRSG